PDVVLASSTKKSLTILNNKSTNTAIAFDVVHKTGLTYLGRHVKVGDMDSDGKPDITFTSVDDNLLLLPASKVSVFRNQSCMVPEVTPEGPLNVCNSLAQELEATKGGGVTYEWTNLTTGISTAGTHLFTPTITGEYLVTATSEGGACTEQSNTVDVTITAGTAADPLPVYNEPLCLGNTLSFSLDNDLGAGYTYNWTGPEGFSATGSAPTRATARLVDAGEYFLEVIAPGGCVARKQSLIVKVIDRPDFKVTYPNSEILCSGQFKKLSVEPASPDYTYEWFETTAGNLGVTGPTFDIGAGGEYYVEASSSTGCGDIQSTKAKIISVISPLPVFDAPLTACKGQEVTFTDQSTVDGQAEAFYYWNFGDGNSSTDRHGKNIYSSTGVKSVSLTVSYKNNMCARSTVPAKQITITDAPNITILSESGVFDMCPEGSLQLSVSGTFDSFLWNTGETSQSIVVSEGGTYDVNVVAPNGCELKSIREITEYPVPVVSVSATPPVIEEGQSTQLFAEGLQNYSWEPAQSLNTSTIQDPIAMPLTSITYLVSGYDVNNCEGKGSVQVTVKGDAIVSKLMPSNFFSPNADAENPYWLVDQIQEYPQCGVTIYDDKGFKVFDAKPYLENWDGTYKGKQLPDGVYYYVIRCDGEEQTPRMGSITILR
ncbi:MAG TPA: gliding motility-associated C-terminal domain-containing protein, partial [Ohtaekwangia sp.]|nr:gliding motility-associated C-terminal domain-containing protein [Ohtaekwangia sp.]